MSECKLHNVLELLFAIKYDIYLREIIEIQLMVVQPCDTSEDGT